MGIELELLVLLALSIVANAVFARFEIETPAWRKILKWSVLTIGTLGFYVLVGHWSLLLPAAGVAAGGTVHFVWCKRNGIHPLRATPRRRYYELRGWQLPE